MSGEAGKGRAGKNGVGYNDNCMDAKKRMEGRSHPLGGCVPTGVGGSGFQPPPVLRLK